MKVVLLAGGFGTRINEESQYKPKPMIEIGGKPMLWHIMKEYLYYGFDEFIVCAGYKQEYIKDYFAHYFLQASNISFDFRVDGEREHRGIISTDFEPWKVTVVDTGLDSLTGWRIKQVRDYIGNEPFLMTYGDGVCDVDLKALVEFHNSHGKACTLTAVKPEGRFGILDLNGNNVQSFREKSRDDVGYINGGYMVLEPKIFDYIQSNVMFERDPMEHLADDGEIMAYKHKGFWQCMDTLRDKQKLEEMWLADKAPWKVWDK